MHVINYMKILTFTLIFLAVTAGMSMGASTGSDGRVEWRERGKFELGVNPIDFAFSLDGKYAFILTEENTVAVYDRKGTLQGKIPVAPGVSSIDISPQGEFLYLVDTEKKNSTIISVDFVFKFNITDAPFKGLEDAPVTIAVFSDFQ